MNIPSLQKPAGIFSLVLLVLLTLPLIAIAGSGEEANAVIDRWSAAYSSNDPEAPSRFTMLLIKDGGEWLMPITIPRHEGQPAK